MIHHLDAVRGGYDIDADVVVVGSGAGGMVAAANFAAAGMRTVLVEAGPVCEPADMTRDAPRFLAKYYWEGGLRLAGGTAPNPSMQGRCFGGSTVVNSAIMLRLPPWVRHIWAAEDGLRELVLSDAFERGFDRAFERCGVAPTPMAVMGRRNLLVRDALTAVDIPGRPLPRAVVDCVGCADCITGCHEGRKRSVDRAYGPAALRDGLTVMTCSEVERVDMRGKLAVGVSGRVVDPDGWRRTGRFRVRAPRVVMAAGCAATPAILLGSGITGGGLVGASCYAHMTTGCVAVMDERVDPWVGATQGWGAISPDIRGLKYESLWAAPSLIAVNFGGMGEAYLRGLADFAHATVVACVYRARCRGRVGRRMDGSPAMKIWFDEREVAPLMRGLKRAIDGLFAVGARYVTPSVKGVPRELRSAAEAEVLVSGRVAARQLSMTYNHLFGSCRMSADPRRGPVDMRGAVRGVDGVYVMDASLFPSPSAVNPQATIMALSDVLSRRLAGLAA